jgi:hypothetical protein
MAGGAVNPSVLQCAPVRTRTLKTGNREEEHKAKENKEDENEEQK